MHTVLGGWYTKQGQSTNDDPAWTELTSVTELAKRACIFFASAFIGSMFSGYLVS